MTRDEIEKVVIGELALGQLDGLQPEEHLQRYVSLALGLYWRGRNDGLEEAAQECDLMGGGPVEAIRTLKTIARKL